MSGRRPRRVPTAPLHKEIRRKERSGLSRADIAAEIGVSRRQLQRLIDQDGITVAGADNWACRLGLHLEILWPEVFSTPESIEIEEAEARPRPVREREDRAPAQPRPVIRVWVDDARREKELSPALQDLAAAVKQMKSFDQLCREELASKHPDTTILNCQMCHGPFVPELGGDEIPLRCEVCRKISGQGEHLFR